MESRYKSRLNIPWVCLFLLIGVDLFLLEYSTITEFSRNIKLIEKGTVNGVNGVNHSCIKNKGKNNTDISFLIIIIMSPKHYHCKSIMYWCSSFLNPPQDFWYILYCDLTPPCGAKLHYNRVSVKK